MAVLEDGDLADLWDPVASLTGVRIVEARAAVHKRRASGVDLIAAHTQVPMGCDRPCYAILPQVVHQVTEDKDHAKYIHLKWPVRRAKRARYGIPRAGVDFIRTFGGWLKLLRWQPVPEAPALFTVWQTGPRHPDAASDPASRQAAGALCERRESFAGARARRV